MFRGSAHRVIKLGLGNVPSVIEEAIPGDVAGLLVIFPRVQRSAFVGPLFASVIARDDRVIGRRC